MVYVLLLVFVCGALAVRFLTDPKWKPSLVPLWILLVPFALVSNHRLWRRLRMLAVNAPEPMVPMWTSCSP